MKMSKVLVNVPVGGITITGNDGKQIKIPAGISPRDKGLTEHWYFEAAGGVVLGEAPDDDEDAVELAEDVAELEDAEAKNDVEGAAKARAKIDAVKRKKG
jgi:hypothetical protein